MSQNKIKHSIKNKKKIDGNSDSSGNLIKVNSILTLA